MTIDTNLANRIIAKHQQINQDLFLTDSDIMENENMAERLRKAFEATPTEDGVYFHVNQPKRRKAKAHARQAKRRQPVVVTREGELLIPTGMKGESIKVKRRKPVLSQRAHSTIERAIDKEAGLTLNASGQLANRKSGYSVSLAGTEIRVIVDSFSARGRIVYQIMRMLQDNPNRYDVGLWVDSGVAYIDYSIHVADKADALRVGADNNQKAIFGWAEQECFNV